MRRARSAAAASGWEAALEGVSDVPADADEVERKPLSDAEKEGDDPVDAPGD